MGSQMLLLNWNEHKNNVIGEFQQLFSRSELTDVTLACDGYSLEAHKTVLSASSAFFRNLFLHRRCDHAFVILADMDSESLKAIVDFMYQGQIHISQEKLTQFLKTAEKLKIKGLSTFSQDESPSSSEEPVTASSRSESGEHMELSLKRQPSVRSHPDNSYQTLERTELSSKGIQPPLRSHSDNSFQALEQPELPSKRQPTVRRHLDNTFQTLEQTELSPKRLPTARPHLDSSFQTSEIQQQELSLTSGGTNEIQEPELDLTPTTYKTLKNESCDITPSVHEYCSVDVLEPPNFSSSLHNIPSSSSEASLNQPVTMPVQSISQETSQWVSQIFPSDDSHSSTFETIPANHQMGSTVGSILIGTQKSSNSNEMENSSTYMASIGNPANEATSSALSESPKSGGCDNRSFQLTKLPTKVLDKSYFTHPSLQCLVSSETFITRSKLLSHQRTRTEEQTLRCTVCNKRFRQKHGLKFHMMAHFGEKPYSCNICDRKFCRPYSLTVHKRLHTGEKPFSCTYCGKRFSDKSNLVVHLRVNH